MTHPHVILNIGLMIGEGRIELPATAAYKAMRYAGILWERVQQHESSTENTLVVGCYATDAQVDEVAKMLEQDCIAVWDLMHREGRLVGPRAAAWGEFNPEFFLLLNGSRLSEARSVAA